MGGYGSGRYWRSKVRTCCEQLRQLDISDLRKKGIFTSDRRVVIGTISWTSNAEPNGKLQYSADKDGITFAYHYNSGNDWKSVKKRILFKKTACNYGGYRYWFSCPDCYRRVAVLYLYGHRFSCRKCLDLSYASQHEGYLDRMFRKTRKIRRRLDASEDLFEGVWLKPKGMHQRTFDRLRWREMEAHNKINLAMAAKFGWVLPGS